MNRVERIFRGGIAAIAVSISVLLGPGLADVAGAAPVAPTQTPMLSGSAIEGSSLSFTASWTTNPSGDTLSYSDTWYQCTSSPAGDPATTSGCTAVQGPITSSTSGSSYMLASTDVGDYIVADETATDTTDTSMTNAPVTETTSVAGPIASDTPVVSTTAPPAITTTGTIADGETVTASAGTWSNTPSSYSYAWSFVCSGTGCTTSATQTDSSVDTTDSYPISPTAGAGTLTLTVTASNLDGGTGTAAGPVSVAVVAPAASGAPAFSGAAVVGQPVTVSNGSWNFSPSPTFAYQWLLCTTGTAAAPTGCGTTALSTTSSVTPTADQVGDFLEVTVTATAGSVTASSTASEVVQPTAPTETQAPGINGTPQVGQTLTVVRANWSTTPAFPTTVSDVWELCSSDGDDCAQVATGITFVPAAADVGGTLEVVETAVNVTGSTPDYSALTSPVANAAGIVPAPAPEGVAIPAISGQPQLGATLSATAVAFSDNGATTDQWLRCGSSGCAAIPGATGLSYTVSAADVGEALAIQESSTNAGGTTQVASLHTAAVTASSSTSLQAATTGVAGRSLSLIAAVSTGAPSADASGTITFASNGQPIPGCTAMALTAGAGQPLICAAAFGAADQTVTATFVPAAGAFVASSASAPVTIAVRRVSTRIALTSSTKVSLNRRFTYRASVTPRTSGSLAATGRVRFLDGTHTITDCARRKVAKGQATCTITYRATGRHVISARYAGNGSFAPATSPNQAVTVAPQAPSGVVSAFMSWTFDWGPRGTLVRALTVTGLARGTSIAMSCAGAGCAFRDYVHRVHGARQPAGSFDLKPVFRGRRLRVGSRLTVRLAHAGWLGKYYRFTIRRGNRPALEESCLAVGGVRPSVGCTGT